MGADEFAVDMDNKSLFEKELRNEAISKTNSTEEAMDYYEDKYDSKLKEFEFKYNNWKNKKADIGIDLAKSPDISHDPVNHPNHYCTGRYECMEVMEEVFGREKFMDYCYLNAFKYIWRSERKNGVEDIKKAIFYLNKFVEMYEKNREEK